MHINADFRKVTFRLAAALHWWSPTLRTATRGAATFLRRVSVRRQILEGSIDSWEGNWIVNGLNVGARVSMNVNARFTTEARQNKNPRGHMLSFLAQRTLLGIRSRSHSHHKIGGWRRADILNAVLVVGMNKSH
jgi:hypothetical protein